MKEDAARESRGQNLSEMPKKPKSLPVIAAHPLERRQAPFDDPALSGSIHGCISAALAVVSASADCHAGRLKRGARAVDVLRSDRP